MFKDRSVGTKMFRMDDFLSGAVLFSLIVGAPLWLPFALLGYLFRRVTGYNLWDREWDHVG
jgi:hypothetical protein